MFKFTKKDAEFAAVQFSCGLYEWTRSFTGSPNGISFERDVFVSGKYDSSLIEKNNFRDGEFAQNITSIFDFAETGTWQGVNIFDDQEVLENQLGEILTPLAAFDEVFSKDIDFQEYFEVKVGSLFIIDILRDVVNAAFARYRLIDGTLSLEEIALLGNVSLKTVQNAVSSKSKDRLVVSSTMTYKGGKSAIDAQEARRWLLTKKGFTGPYFLDDLPTYDEYLTLGQFQHHCLSLLKNAGLELSDIKQKLSWSDELVKAFTNIIEQKVNDDLNLITPLLIKQFGEAVSYPKLKQFVTEGSKIIASTLAEYQATLLFKA